MVVGLGAVHQLLDVGLGHVLVAHAVDEVLVDAVDVPGIGARGDLTFLQLAFGYLIGRIGIAVWLLPGYFRGEQETAWVRRWPMEQIWVVRRE